jgi:hypothetical protein
MKPVGSTPVRFCLYNKKLSTFRKGITKCIHLDYKTSISPPQVGWGIPIEAHAFAVVQVCALISKGTRSNVQYFNSIRGGRREEGACLNPLWTGTKWYIYV